MYQITNRLLKIADKNSLSIVEQNRSAITVATGKVSGISVVLYGIDESRRGGAFGWQERTSLIRGIHLAEEAKVPLVGLWASSGADIIEGQWSLLAAWEVFRACHSLSSSHFFLSYGNCIGMAAYISKLCDVVLGIEGQTHLCLTGPKVVEAVTFEKSSLHALGGTEVLKRRGDVHLIAENEEEMVASFKEVFNFLKGRTWLQSEKGERKGEKKSATENLIESLVDGGKFVTLWETWAPNVIAFLAFIGTRPVAIFANHPACAGGIIDREAALKGARFYLFAERFKLPIISIVDTPGFLPGEESESSGILSAGGEMIDAYLKHRQKKIAIAVGKVYGGAYMAMGCGSMGADATFALKNAEIGVMGADIAAKILGFSNDYLRTYRDRHISATSAQQLGLVDKIITLENAKREVLKVLR